MLSKKIYDLAVIGSGGGTYLPDKAIETGHQVALIEGSDWGGTCLNHGCIPTKIMVHVADVIKMTRQGQDLALKGNPMEVDWPKLEERVFSKLQEGEGMVDYYAPYPNIDLYKAFASFAGREEIEGETIFVLNLSKGGQKQGQIKARQVVIANGARTNIPMGLGLEEVKPLTSETLFKRETWPKTLPKTMLILGGGDIGTEFAYVFQSFGVKVSLIQRSGRLVPKQDPEVSDRLKNVLVDYGVNVLTNKTTIEASLADGQKYLRLKDRESGEEETLTADEIFVCTGVRSNVDTLALENIGLETVRGYIPTNAYLETAVPGIYAMGDVNGMYQLRHVSNYEGQILAHNLMDPSVKRPEDRRKVDYSAIPRATFTVLQIGQVGLTEPECLAQNLDYKVGYLRFSDTAQGYARGFLPEHEKIDGFCKVLVEKDTHRILGVHIMADEASSLITPFTYLLAMDPEKHAPNRYENVTEAMTVHPSLSELSAWAFENWRE